MGDGKTHLGLGLAVWRTTSSGLNHFMLDMLIYVCMYTQYMSSTQYVSIDSGKL